MTAKSIERNEKKFLNLPTDYQEAIKTSDYDNNLVSIAKKYKLHIDQSATLEILLEKLIFGEIKATDMISEIQDNLSISRNEALAITLDLDKMIIKPIKENLKIIQTEV